ncbi:nucleotidyltransferase [Streptococcus pacificus]|uniref:tRNA(Met) cytidine acetate ligase n=1 Tax=Streptococcus pacificus TaxID=2740577 RepID=A0ABS0ZK91_9STRE|nr:nucleotidyltransferase [Streptococcus pacificus]MBJ8326434.1 nucleotidyltransferase [Streptococcus pacificus]
MTITGIIAEFNPFHYGHRYLLEQLSGLKIIAMSGNFTQRGEPAIVDKWLRAQMALENGADIVVELPFLVSVQSADYFAKGALSILNQLGIEELAFGTEENSDYHKLLDDYRNKQEEMEQFIKQQPHLKSYPEKSQAMWQQLSGISFSGQTPNHILALSYIKGLAPYDIQLKPIKRIGAGFHSLDKTASIVSATAIRQHLKDQNFLKKATPSWETLLKAPTVSWDNYFQFLKYNILSHHGLTEIYQVNEEMASRIKTAITSVENIDELIAQVATKRYTKARVRRLLTYILVNVKDSPLPEKIHVLGFSQKGQRYLSQLENKEKLVTRIGKEAWDKTTQKADAIYQMGNEEIQPQTYGRIPIMNKPKS